MNVDGLSEQTLDKFIDGGFIGEFADIYNLEQHKNEIINMEGFGKRSYEKLVNSINKSRDTEMYRVIYAMSIPNIGRSASKAIAKHFGYSIEKFLEAIENGYDFTVIEDFGEITNQSICEWFNDYNNMLSFENVLAEVNIVKPETTNNQSTGLKDLSGLTFVVTGTVNTFKNRKEVEDLITSLNGKLSSAVSNNTNFLLNNDFASTSSKNQKAKQLNIPIITEDQFNEMIGRTV
jgi:DNA ligase (NAD+)